MVLCPILHSPREQPCSCVTACVHNLLPSLFVRYVSAMTTPARMSPVDFHTPTSPKSPPSEMSPPVSSLTISIPSVAVSPFMDEERPLLLVTPPRLREKYDNHLQQFNSFHNNPTHESNSLPPSPLRIVEDGMRPRRSTNQHRSLQRNSPTAGG